MNEYIEQNIDDAHVRQILFSICGSKFVRQYYKDFEAHQPQLLCEPYMSPHVRESLSEEYQEKLDEFVHERVSFVCHVFFNWKYVDCRVWVVRLGAIRSISVGFKQEVSHVLQGCSKPNTGIK